MNHLFEYLLRLGDSTLVLGHRLSEWCGTGPALEEDIALANTSLDMIGQTRLWLDCAAEVENRGRSADDLAYLRDAWEFRNLLLLEQPNRDFAVTMMRQYLFDAYHVLLLDVLQNAKDQRIADIAAKCNKEAIYHLQRSTDIVVALGDGTAESHARMQGALDRLWPYTGEMFSIDDTDKQMYDSGIGPDLELLRINWLNVVQPTLGDAQLDIPTSDFSHLGGKNGVRHTEHLGHMLATMQVLQRSYPGVQW